MSDQAEKLAVTAELRKMTVFLSPASYGSLLESEKTTGHSRTDVVNRALQLYAFYVKQAGDGWLPALTRDGRTVPFKIE